MPDKMLLNKNKKLCSVCGINYDNFGNVCARFNKLMQKSILNITGTRLKNKRKRCIYFKKMK